MLGKDIKCAVSGTAIDNNIFNVFVVLPKNTFHRIFYRIGVVETNCDD